MNGTMVSIKEIRSWVMATLDAVEHKNGPEVELASTFYWDINFQEAFDLSAQPTPTVGDVADDILDIREDVKADVEERSLSTWHTLEHLRGILGALAARDYKVMERV